MDKNRFILKSGFGKDFDSGQKRGLDQPSPIKSHGGASLINLPALSKRPVKNHDIYSCLLARKTHRLFDENHPMTLEELSFLLNISQGVRGLRQDNNTLRKYVPSASGRHSFETYIIANNIENLPRGVYRYLDLENKLLEVYRDDAIDISLKEALNGQIFGARAAAVFAWTCLPERMEWRFGDLAEKLILLDGGHLCQNLYLGAEALDLGACSIADYSQEKMDSLLHVDGLSEITTYIGLCGKKRD